MKLTIKPDFNKDFIKKNVDVFLANLEKAVLMRLQKIGEEFISYVRQNHGYKDKTGNLTSSTGYVILKNGQAYFEGGFTQVAQGTEGATRGQMYIAKIAEQYPTGWVLIGVAGMSYAAAVEAKGFDVLTGGSKLAESALIEAIATLNRKVG